MIIMAIDPDIEKSGIAIFELNIATRKAALIRIESVSFPVLIDMIREVMKGAQSVVYVEAGWLNKWNWHLSGIKPGKVGDVMQAAAKVGEKVGANFETGRKIIEFCKHFGVEVEEVKPLLKYWNGPQKKITKIEIRSYYGSEYPLLKAVVTNEEMRDAFLIGHHKINELKIKLCTREAKK